MADDSGQKAENNSLLNLENIPLKDIGVDFNSRDSFSKESIASLAKDIERCGLINPVTVEVFSNGHYGLIAGERRLAAFSFLSRKVIPCIVKKNLTPQKRFEIHVAENANREDLTAEEKLNICLVALKNGYCKTKKQLAKLLGCSYVHIWQLMSLQSLDRQALKDAGSKVSISTLKMIADIEGKHIQRKLVQDACNGGIQDKLNKLKTSARSVKREAPRVVEISDVECLPSNCKVVVTKKKGYRLVIESDDYTLTSLVEVFARIWISELKILVDAARRQLNVGK